MIAAILTAVIEDKVDCIARNQGQTLHHMLIADLLLTIEHIDGCRELDIAGEALKTLRRLGEPDFTFRNRLIDRVRSMAE
jgi:hypothetical protein